MINVFIEKLVFKEDYCLLLMVNQKQSQSLMPRKPKSSKALYNFPIAINIMRNSKKVTVNITLLIQKEYLCFNFQVSSANRYFFLPDRILVAIKITNILNPKRGKSKPSKQIITIGTKVILPFNP